MGTTLIILYIVISYMGTLFLFRYMNKVEGYDSEILIMQCLMWLIFSIAIFPVLIVVLLFYYVPTNKYLVKALEVIFVDKNH